LLIVANTPIAFMMGISASSCQIRSAASVFWERVLSSAGRPQRLARHRVVEQRLPEPRIEDPQGHRRVGEAPLADIVWPSRFNAIRIASAHSASEPALFISSTPFTSTIGTLCPLGLWPIARTAIHNNGCEMGSGRCVAVDHIRGHADSLTARCEISGKWVRTSTLWLCVG
jgi:hypothetical protein